MSTPKEETSLCDLLQSFRGKEHTSGRPLKQPPKEDWEVAASMLHSAKKEIAEIKQEHLERICSQRIPPPAIFYLLRSIMLIVQAQDSSWNGMKAFLASSTMKEQMIQFDLGTLTQDIRKTVHQIINCYPDAFRKERITLINAAASSLAFWVVACVNYSAILEPLLFLDQGKHHPSSIAENKQEPRCTCTDYELAYLEEEVARLEEEVASCTEET